MKSGVYMYLAGSHPRLVPQRLRLDQLQDADVDQSNETDLGTPESSERVIELKPPMRAEAAVHEPEGIRSPPSDAIPSDAVGALWDVYKESGDQRAREGLILHYSPLVKFVAGRVGSGLPRNVDQNDLVSFGTFGLIDAVDKFEPERGFTFETYAVNRIKGAILDELRALDWVPRSVRSRAREIQRTMAELEHRLQRTPSEDEIAAAMDVPLTTLRHQLGEITNFGFLALDLLFELPDGDSVPTTDKIVDTSAVDPSDSFEKKPT